MCANFQASISTGVRGEGGDIRTQDIIAISLRAIMKFLPPPLLCYGGICTFLTLVKFYETILSDWSDVNYNCMYTLYRHCYFYYHFECTVNSIISSDKIPFLTEKKGKDRINFFLILLNIVMGLWQNILTWVG